MTTITEIRNQSNRLPAQIELLAGMFFLLSLGLFAALGVMIFTNPTLLNAERTPSGILWSFISSLGIIRPMGLAFAAGLCFRLSLALRRGNVAAGRWAVALTTWAAVLSGVTALYVFGRALIDNPTNLLQWPFERALIWIVLLIAALAARRFSLYCLTFFTGDEPIPSRNTRRAWNLLVPTLLVIFLIALNPLEQVFISSLTDAAFARSDAINFVGLENYNQLWSVRLDRTDCERDTANQCVTELDENGNPVIVYERPRRSFARDSEYNVLRYNDFADFELFGEHFVLSARDDKFIQALGTSAYYTVFAIVLQFTLGFFIALILAQRVRGLGFLRVMMLVPMAIPTLIATQFWDVMLAPNANGLINALLLQLGWISEAQRWLLDPVWQVPTLVAVIVWKETPITALLLLPGIISISQETYQAAAIDGANRLQRFFTMTLPIMWPTIGIVLVLRTMLFLRVFDLFWVLVGRNRYVVATYAYDVLLQEQKLGYSSAISVTIFVITMTLTIIYMRRLRIDES
ncbi:MAG: carbohydrate ABC transporter permease [Phototrophicaceae bacterium]|jgi:trehalose/maltose transport system permease protein